MDTVALINTASLLSSPPKHSSKANFKLYFPTHPVLMSYPFYPPTSPRTSSSFVHIFVAVDDADEAIISFS